LLLAIIVGIFLGVAFPHFASQLKPLGDLFIRLIRMLLAPIIFGTVVVGIARMGDIRAVGRVGIKALLYFEIVSTSSLLIGLVVVNVVQPGAGMHVDPKLLDTGAIATYTAAAKTHGILEFFLNIVPTSIAAAFVDGNMLQVILLALLFGVALSHVGEQKRQLIDLLEAILRVLFGIVRIIMRAAPLGAMGAMAYTVGTYGLHTLRSYAQLMACVYVTSLVFIFVVLNGIARYSGFSLWQFLRYIKDELLITFGTCSTEAVLPQMVAKLEALGCEPSLVGLVLPAGYTFNADGTSIYLTIAAIFIAQATGTHLTWGDQALVLTVLMVTSKGSGGVAGAGFVTLAATLASMDKIPVAGLALLLGADSFLNQSRAVTNLIGNGVATLAIARWEGMLDREKAKQIQPRRRQDAEVG
jgi:DAACS family dicarboxylate/amino acid:cation (Na+ or H+) symporter/aerobic C4-dicarboxylate transport protein